MNSENSLLKIENLETSFNTERGIVRAVNEVSFEIGKGEILGLVGESGSGKSVTALSTIRLLGRNATVSADRLEYAGQDLLSLSNSEMRDVRGGKISMVFQDPMNSLNPVMSVGEQIAEVVRHHTDVGESTSFLHEMRRKYVTGVSEESESWQRAIDLLETVGIPEPEKRANEYPHQLSGGMRQRVVIAQALAGEPDLIIADEPTTALDVSVEAQILNQLLDLRDEFDLSILLITHDLGVVKETCDDVVVMYAGEVMEKGPVEDIFSNPRHPYTQGLLDSIPRLTDSENRLDVIEGNVPSAIDRPEGCPFRERCDEAFGMCDQPLQNYESKDGRIVRCHHYHEELREEDTLVHQPKGEESVEHN